MAGPCRKHRTDERLRMSVKRKEARKGFAEIAPGTRSVQRPEQEQGEQKLVLRMELRSDPSALSVVRGAMERVAELLGFTAEETRAIVRAVDEALANVIEHAYEGQGGLPIAVTCSRVRGGDAKRGEGLEVVLEDEGNAAEASELKGRDLEELRPGGLGLHFMRSAMDQVEFTRNGGKNRLRLVKYRHLIPAHSCK